MLDIQCDTQKHKQSGSKQVKDTVKSKESIAFFEHVWLMIIDPNKNTTNLEKRYFRPKTLNNMSRSFLWLGILAETSIFFLYSSPVVPGSSCNHEKHVLKRGVWMWFVEVIIWSCIKQIIWCLNVWKILII